jgi:hypothetical protein
MSPWLTVLKNNWRISFNPQNPSVLWKFSKTLNWGVFGFSSFSRKKTENRRLYQNQITAQHWYRLQTCWPDYTSQIGLVQKSGTKGGFHEGMVESLLGLWHWASSSDAELAQFGTCSCHWNFIHELIILHTSTWLWTDWGPSQNPMAGLLIVRNWQQ